MVVADRESLTADAGLLLSIRAPSQEEALTLKPGTMVISLLDPFNEKALIETLRDREVTAISLEMIPRITRAQKMDVLSSRPTWRVTRPSSLRPGGSPRFSP